MQTHLLKRYKNKKINERKLRNQGSYYSRGALRRILTMVLCLGVLKGFRRKFGPLCKQHNPQKTVFSVSNLGNIHAVPAWGSASLSQRPA